VQVYSVKQASISVLIPVHNEEKIVRNNAERLARFLAKSKFVKQFEVILIDNGSTDRTYEVMRKIEDHRIISIHIAEKGIGRALKKGIKSAIYEDLFFYAIDLPFGLSVIDDSILEMQKQKADMVIGSKGHKKSVVKAPFTRKVFSSAYSLLVNLFFRVGVKDFQGSLLFRKGKVDKIIRKLTSPDAFFETQISINGHRNGWKIVEIPVVYEAPRKDSKIRPFADGLHMFRQIVGEARK
jgi:glycosyltransferase involved in cell wall biosynthesis